MKVAFATYFDPGDIRRGSGTWYSLSREMERQGHQLHYVGPLVAKDPVVTRVFRKLQKKAGWRYLTFLDPFLAKARGREVANHLAGVDYDLLVTNDPAIAGYTPTRKPVVLYTDVMLPIDYPNRVPPRARVGGCSRLGAALFRQTIRKALRQAALCIFPTKWQVEQALEYGVDPSKVRIIPFGANLPDPGGEVAANRRFADVVRKGRVDLLFVGKEWARKGGDIAVRTVSELRCRHIDARLHVAGTTPPGPVDTEFVKVHGLLDKAIDTDRAKLDGLFRSSDICILPSSSEGFVIVGLEAAAYGLPVLAYNAEGVATAVVDGVTGRLMELGQSEHYFADVVQQWFEKPSNYDRLVAGARKHYEETANWNKSVSTLFAEIRKHLGMDA